MNIPIVLDRPDFVVCEKLPGINAEGNGLPALLCAQESFPALYPVHRLDQGTGGLTVLAKTPAAAAKLSEFFSSEAVKKEYYAVVQAEHLEPSGTFTDLLFHDRRTNKTYVVNRERKGVRQATCEWELVESALVRGLPCRLVRVFLHSGRTHQIRIQFASRKMPLAGDARYGSTIKAPYPALWAAGLSFPDPKDPASVFSFRSVPPAAEPWDAFLFFTAAGAGGSGALPPRSI